MFPVGHVILSLYRTLYEHIEVRVSCLDKLKALAFTLLVGRESSDPLNTHPRSYLETRRNLYGLSYLGEAWIRGDIQETIADPISGAIIWSIANLIALQIR